MLHRFPSLPGVFRALTAAALAYSIFWWSVLAPGAAFDGSECFAALRLVWCCLVLSLFGQAAIAVTARFCARSAISSEHENKSSLARLPYMSNAIIALAIGQLVAMSWVFARSALSGIAYAFTGRQLPITTLEIMGLLIGAGFIVLRSRRPTLRPHNTLGAFGFLGVLVCIVAPLAFRDLPRSVALSSDPDQHAFWAAQVYKLGIVPWDQGLTGVGPFGYPAGFAVLNAVWMAFSGLTAVEIVTIQPMLQFLLAVVLCAGVGPLLLDRRSLNYSNDHRSVALSALCGIVIYWFFLPYGLQGERFHGEGTARLSCSLLSAIPLLLWISLSSSSQSIREFTVRLVIAAIALALIATLNPLAALLPGLFVCLIGLHYLWRTIRTKQIPTGGYGLALSALAVVMIIGGEPYFVTRFAGALGISSGAITPSGSQTNSANLFSLTFSTAQTWHFFEPATLVSYLLAGTYTGNDVMPAVYSVLGLAYAVWMYCAPGKALRGLAAALVCGLVGFTFHGLSTNGSAELPLYLIQPYVFQTVLQCGAILCFCLLSPLLLILFSTRGGLPTSTAGLAVACSFCLAHPIVARTEAFNMNIRGGYCGTMACLSAGDRSALHYIEELGSQIRLKYPDLTYTNAPKILILGIPATLGTENWVFPSGSTRVVPLFSSIPVAFFYGRGHQDWSFDNYQDRLCKDLDLNWLKKRNVRYMFLAKNDAGCMKRRREIVRQGKVLFDEGGARVIQLF